MKRSARGQSIVEVLLSLAIFAIALTGSGMLLFRYIETFRRAEAVYHARIISEESLEAVHGIAANNWSDLTLGVHGLDMSTGHWELTGVADVIAEKYTRQVTISTVRRDATCAIVESGGNIDLDTKKVDIIISWNEPTGAVQQAFSKYTTTNWDNPSDCGVAANFVMNVSAARIDNATKKSLWGILIKNIGTQTITLDKMTLTWSNFPPEKIAMVKINGVILWQGSPVVGLPAGNQNSGVELNLNNFDMPVGPNSYQVDQIRFDSIMSGATFTITSKFTDGSTSSVIVTPPTN